MQRLKELGELTMLQNKRCKNTGETAMIVLEVDRRKRKISDIGGKPPDEDVCINVVWMSMDPATRAHVTGKVDMKDVSFVELRQVVQSYTNLIASTTHSGRSGGVVAMDISSIASVDGHGATHPDGASPNADATKQQSPALWSLDETGWPIDEKGIPLEANM